MTFKKYTEAFDKPFDFKHQKTNTEGELYTFQDTEGFVFEVSIVTNDTSYRDSEGERRTRTIANVLFKKDGSLKKSPGGEPFRVFATVYAIMLDYNFNDVDGLEIGLDKGDNSRLKLYKSMMKKLQKKFKMRHAEEEHTSDYIFLQISR